MPETIASHDMPDPTSRASAPPARVALDSAPRQGMPLDRVPASGVPLPPPWPSLEHETAGMGSVNEMPAISGAGGADDMESIDEFDSAEDMADDMDAEGDFPPRRPEDRATRPLFAPEQWVSDPDFWESRTHIALTGRHPVPRPKTIALKPPERFHPIPRWKSFLILLLVCVLVAFTIAGGFELVRLGMQVLGPAQHSATPVPTHTLVVPTATPHHKK